MESSRQERGMVKYCAMECHLAVVEETAGGRESRGCVSHPGEEVMGLALAWDRKKVDHKQFIKR